MSDQLVTAIQIAALPVRWDKTGKLRVLMVTSRDTGRWVMPKGWLMDGKKPWHAAEIEALEEAGAVGFISHNAIGTYHYDKRLSDTDLMPCEVTLYPMVVEKLNKRWKERLQRKRHWFSPGKAATLVDEKDLSRILKMLADRAGELKIMQNLREAS
ncbi:NUDIX hydrolase [Roseobacter litoralis]|uniref:NUDIX hydrolase-like protein n=1 Tax=Roseobacter litoralis (strain ATCC 49566 / DSM 6996 / JCM 21268 / NBRC 15278 / OCh 149) TaxID=391595 RepID=F7ZFV2_ROSLO|nr:NUDIX hydrolase [Roseobacter litoralis]AEI92292.1 NUDIX hydrolase-like protein [Roseobacter litoralis Och 149]